MVFPGQSYWTKQFDSYYGVWVWTMRRRLPGGDVLKCWCSASPWDLQDRARFAARLRRARGDFKRLAALAERKTP
ncbi:hypothetical protein AAW51_2123 [Caldimonas brevitalea]|uniref:Uncharacterized protein n=1 Tax=Caldimonas brevitalea TaxID=413882 RepID=A0A0G3BHC3_9BURK|nr:hypothetical protein AAW51_2123 [Caldimonas brevitalea]